MKHKRIITILDETIREEVYEILKDVEAAGPKSIDRVLCELIIENKILLKVETSLYDEYEVEVKERKVVNFLKKHAVGIAGSIAGSVAIGMLFKKLSNLEDAQLTTREHLERVDYDSEIDIRDLKIDVRGLKTDVNTVKFGQINLGESITQSIALGLGLLTKEEIIKTLELDEDELKDYVTEQVEMSNLSGDFEIDENYVSLVVEREVNNFNNKFDELLKEDRANQ